MAKYLENHSISNNNNEYILFLGFNIFSKIELSLDMLTGSLEIYPMFIFFFLFII